MTPFFPGARDGQNLISCDGRYLYLQTQFGEDRCTQFRVNVVTDPQTNKQTQPQTHKQTGPITIDCATKLSTQCNCGVYVSWCLINVFIHHDQRREQTRLAADYSRSSTTTD